MLGFRLPFARRKGYGMGASGGGNEGASSASSLLTSLISYWKLDEASGTRVDSVTASANDLTDNNTVLSATGVLGSAAHFVRVNVEFLNRASNASLNVNGYDWTIAAWLKNTSVVGEGNYFITKWLVAAQESYMLLYSATSSRFSVTVRDTGASKTLAANTFGAATDGVWYFVCAQYDATTHVLSISVNNGSMDTLASVMSVDDSNADFCMGRIYNYAAQSVNGDVDEVGLWKSAPGGGGKLSAAQITSLYNGGAGVTYPFVGVP